MAVYSSVRRAPHRAARLKRRAMHNELNMQRAQLCDRLCSSTDCESETNVHRLFVDCAPNCASTVRANVHRLCVDCACKCASIVRANVHRLCVQMCIDCVRRYPDRYQLELISSQTAHPIHCISDAQARGQCTDIIPKPYRQMHQYLAVMSCG